MIIKNETYRIYSDRTSLYIGYIYYHTFSSEWAFVYEGGGGEGLSLSTLKDILDKLTELSNQ